MGGPTKQDAIFLIGVVLALFVVWLAAGGPSRPQARQPFIVVQPENIVAGTTTARAFRDPLLSPQGVWLQQFFWRLAQEGEARANLPPVAFVYGAAGAQFSDPRREFLALALSPSATSSVTISGWRLVSRLSGASAVIPQGVEDVRPEGPQKNEPIRLFPGDIALLTTGTSPLGFSFLTNRCSGYFAEAYESWYPPLRRECPNPAATLRTKEDAQATYGALCLDFLSRVPACSTPNEVLPPSVGERCDDLVATTYSYAGCYRVERGKETFWGNEWRVFFGLDRELWGNRHDIIDLVDEQGRVVASVRY